MINEAVGSAPKTNYPGNSHKAKTKVVKDEKERPKVEKVVTGTVVKRKKGLGRKFTETFTGDDAKSVGEYIFFDVVVPAAKAMISDAASQGVERLLFGETVRSRSARTVGGHTSYNRMYSPNREDRPSGPPSRNISQRARATHNFDEVILSSRAEAEEVIDCLTNLIEDYDVASVADLYDLVDITGSFTDSKWGWSSMQGASVTHIRQGYLLNLPPTMALD